MAEIGNQDGKRMWPSLHTADVLFSISNFVLIVGLALTVVATIGAVWMANVREGYLKRELADANAKIAEASARGDEARATAAEANRKAEEERLARVQLEARIAPRRLSGEQMNEFAGALQLKPGHAVVVSSTMLNAEASDFAADLASALSQGNWNVILVSRDWLLSDHGVFVGTTPAASPEAAKTPGDALTAIGVPHQTINMESVANRIGAGIRDGAVYLFVGSKPQ